MAMAILVINSGSSSMKVALFNEQSLFQPAPTEPSMTLIFRVTPAILILTVPFRTPLSIASMTIFEVVDAIALLTPSKTALLDYSLKSRNLGRAVASNIAITSVTIISSIKLKPTDLPRSDILTGVIKAPYLEV
jgi:hypothetical protein